MNYNINMYVHSQATRKEKGGKMKSHRDNPTLPVPFIKLMDAVIPQAI